MSNFNLTFTKSSDNSLTDLPTDRPNDANAIAIALPGGDPWAATLAAGDTPSPQMVAAAKVV